MQRKAWIFLTTCEFNTDEMPLSPPPKINSADEIC